MMFQRHQPGLAQLPRVQLKYPLHEYVSYSSRSAVIKITTLLRGCGLCTVFKGWMVRFVFFGTDNETNDLPTQLYFPSCKNSP